MSIASDSHVHFDGDFSKPVQNGPWVPTTDNETQSTLYTAEFMQIAANFVRMPFGTLAGLGLTIPALSSLVEETEGTSPGGPLVKWNRTFANVPDSRVVAEGFVFNYQFIQTDPPAVVEFPLYVTSQVQYDYFLTNDPSRISISLVYKLQQVGNVIYEIGDAPATNSRTIVGENSKIVRWKGNIWERSTRFVPTFSAAVKDPNN